MVDEEGFREFVRARLPRLSRAAYLLAGGHAQAEDLLQGALIKAALHWSKVAAAGDPEAYIRKILYHEHVRTWRRRRFLEHPTADVPDRATAGDETDRAVLRMVLEQALAKLTPRQRAVIVQLDVPAPLQVTVRAVDAKGTVVAERTFVDSTSAGGYEPEVKGW